MMDLEIVDRSVGRSRDTRPALVYLEMSGAVRVSIDASGRISTNKTRPDTVATFWIRAEQAQPLARLVRRYVGRGRADPETMLAALHRAAADLRFTLTPNVIAVERAGEAASKLNRFMDDLRGTGVLREFNQAFKRRRMTAMLNGRGFMNYKTAELRLRRALILLLLNGGQPVVGHFLFSQIFGN
jgi:hypothetical protein